MRCISVCAECGSKDIEHVIDNRCYCNKCRRGTSVREKYIESPFERNERRVYATGNRWAIENWRATHY